MIPLLLVIAFVAFRTWTERLSPEDTVEMTSGDLEVRINYCQPAVKGRTIFGELVPYGQVWRTGANTATSIRFSRDVSLNDHSLKAGKYSLWSVPEKEDWVIVINKEVGQWGTNYDDSKDVLRFSVPSKQTDTMQEMFTISLSEGQDEQILVNLHWDHTAVEFEVK
ncbi:DUF2911 domain-containing protein [Marinilongibacter aquaticus]|uniref:DUF2911 domain-containing protein n=1 Tax=Marinilongibacter aquaticus TaxID=2975157 RepID=UPI0021BD7B4F|nr:DUF2911 domain-containing protein [Marinilongibacter aquaticus]UBM57456.1 DUF2911 domain-containing protein [Marinilongibacter aquaticus]